MIDLTVRPLAVDWQLENYHLAIATLGYEERARYVFERLGASGLHNLAGGFPGQRVLQYQANKNWFEQANFEVGHYSDEQYAARIRDVLTLITVTRPRRVLVDISSMTRVRLARLLEVFTNERWDSEIIVTFVYSLASYDPPPEAAPYNSHVGPVTPSFSGWWEEPDRPIAAIVGLGYEQDKALGAVEHLQSSYVWLFVPKSDVEEYSPAVACANEALLELVPSQRKITYRVDDPHYCYIKLESLVYGILRTHNPVLLPFGPKIFALCALLVGCAHKTAAVWRVSAGEAEAPVNRLPSGLVYGLEVQFGTGRTLADVGFP